MGDVRFEREYTDVRDAPNRIGRLRTMSDESIVEALAGASKAGDTFVANFLATEALNRVTRARRVVDTVMDGVVALDREGRVALVNPAAERVLGWLASEVAGRFAEEVAPAPEGAPRAHPWTAPLRERESNARRAMRFARRDGGTVVLDFEAAPVIVAGDAAGVVVVFRESTERSGTTRGG